MARFNGPSVTDSLGGRSSGGTANDPSGVSGHVALDSAAEAVRVARKRNRYRLVKAGVLVALLQSMSGTTPLRTVTSPAKTVVPTEFPWTSNRTRSELMALRDDIPIGAPLTAKPQRPSGKS